jgi:hypothetical protein
MWLTPSADANSKTVTIVGLRFPFSRPLRYCWLKPEISANCSWVSPLFCLIRLTFCPTSLRISMHGGQPITRSKFINYNMLKGAAAGRRPGTHDGGEHGFGKSDRLDRRG